MCPERFARPLVYSLLINCSVALADVTTAVADKSTENRQSGRDHPALWEIGAGFVVAHTPSYPAADQMSFNALPVPVVIYRGRIFRAGDGSVVSGRLLSSPRLELDISLRGSFDADSDDVDTRQGMPDLGFMFEVGPELEVRLNDPAAKNSVVKLELPLRAAFSIDNSDLNSRGLVFNPGLEFEKTGVFGDGSELSVSMSSSFATEKLMAYFYEVEPRFSVPNRPPYEAQRGYLGSSLGISLSQRKRNRFAIAGIRFHNHAGAANDASPLFESPRNWSVFAGIIWYVWESDRRAPECDSP